MQEIKKGWKKVKLGEIYEFSSGLSKGRKFFGSGYPFLSYKDIFNNYFVPKELNELVESTEKERVSHSVKRGDVFLTRTSETTEEIGMSCVSLYDYSNATFNGFTKRLRPKSDNIIYPEFAGFYFRSKIFRDIITPMCSLITRASLNNDILNELTIYFPESFQTQQKIASILSKYDDLIENNTKRIKILENMAEEIYKEWFVNFRFPGHEKIKMVDSGTEFGEIPEGWVVKKVEEMIKKIPTGKKYDNKTVQPKGNIPVLDQGKSGIIGYHNDEPGVIASMENPIITFSNHTCYQKIIMYPFSAIQNVFALISGNENKSNIFWLHYVTKDLIRFNDYKGHMPEFITKKLLYPGFNLTEKFGNQIKGMIFEIYNLQKQNQNLKQARDLLLLKLVNGEVEVDNLDINI